MIEEKDIPEELPKQKEWKQEEGGDYEDVNTDQECVDEEGDVSMLCMSCLSWSKFSSITMYNRGEGAEGRNRN